MRALPSTTSPSAPNARTSLSTITRTTQRSWQQTLPRNSSSRCSGGASNPARSAPQRSGPTSTRENIWDTVYPFPHFYARVVERLFAALTTTRNDDGTLTERLDAERAMTIWQECRGTAYYRGQNRPQSRARGVSHRRNYPRLRRPALAARRHRHQPKSSQPAPAACAAERRIPARRVLQRPTLVPVRGAE